VHTAEDLDRHVRVLVERLRRMSTTKLASRLVPGDRTAPSRADAARHLAQRLTEAAQSLEGSGPPWRVLPELADLAVGDQLAVVADDLRAALAAVADSRMDADLEKLLAEAQRLRHIL
jgi:hypothetical protein